MLSIETAYEGERLQTSELLTAAVALPVMLPTAAALVGYLAAEKVRSVATETRVATRLVDGRNILKGVVGCIQKRIVREV